MARKKQSQAQPEVKSPGPRVVLEIPEPPREAAFANMVVVTLIRDQVIVDFGFTDGLFYDEDEMDDEAEGEVEETEGEEEKEPALIATQMARVVLPPDTALELVQEMLKNLAELIEGPETLKGEMRKLVGQIYAVRRQPLPLRLP